jgi:acetyltransferase-like isoleucine patch superfamily enzyme
MSQARVQLDIPAGTPLWKRLAILLGHHDSRVYLSPTAYVDVGSGSLPCVKNIEFYQPHHIGSIGRIGRYTQTALSRIIYGGEHDNDSPVNFVFASLPAQQHYSGPDFGRLPGKPINIGNGVVISSGAIVLDGVQIGDGAVIGAGAVLTRPAEPFGIYAGVPARKIGERMDASRRARTQAARWWDFSIPYMCGNMARLQEIALAEGTHDYQIDRPRFVYFGGSLSEPMSVLGASRGTETIPLLDLPEPVQAYVAMAMGDGPYHWLADIWADT